MTSGFSSNFPKELADLNGHERLFHDSSIFSVLSGLNNRLAFFYRAYFHQFLENEGNLACGRKISI